MSNLPIEAEEEAERDFLGRANSRVLRVWVVAATIAAILLCINQVFNLGFFAGYVLPALRYYYILLALMLPLIFIIWPFRKGGGGGRVPLYDFALAVLTIGVFAYFAYQADAIVDEAWEYSAPTVAIICAIILWAVALEVTRRAGGLVLAVIAFLFSAYPVVAALIPGPIQGQPASIANTAIFYAMSSESYMGIPMRAFAGLIIGFLIFGVALQRTGGGRFFMDLAFGLLGHTRGGPAKVAVFGSALMGSLSGSVITNILTTGTLTIPAMRKIGISRSYAAGIETCASTGAVLMPPIMGATAFVMATFLETDYAEIAIAAIVPSLLYFLGLYVQIDSYAARNGLIGMPRSELPSASRALREGWYYIVVFALLIFMLLYLKQEALAPFYATALLLLINQILPYNRWSRDDLLQFLTSVGRILIELMGILMGIGLIVGALAVTGMTGTLTNDLVHLADGNVVTLLFMGAVVSFILGMGMTVTAAYIFLAVTLAPALVKAGVAPLPAHMFILYWGMLSYITPPVAIGAYAAATISGSNPMRTGFVSMRLGSIIYIIPFLFVLSPSLLLQSAFWPSVLEISTAILGVVLIASALQGYLVFVGSLIESNWAQWPARILLVLSGLLLAVPRLNVGLVSEAGGGQFFLIGLSAVLLLLTIGIAQWGRRRATQRQRA